jgi:UDP-N-acetylmuramate dehydrogenase
LVNAGNASTQEIIDLARRIRDHVYSKFGVTLTPEPVTLGFSTSPFA